MLYLHGLGHFHPENCITNEFLEELDIGTNSDWIMERVGIESRRTLLSLEYIKSTKNRDHRAASESSLYTNAQTGAAAARMAIKRANIEPGDIGLVIAGGSAPEYLSPSESATIAAELNIEAPCFDLNSACTTFGVQINFLAALKPEATPPFILLVNPEGITRSVDYQDRNSAVLFGDATSAAVLSAVVPSDKVIVSTAAYSKPSQWEKVTIPRRGFFRQDGNAVQRFAIHKTTEMLQFFLDNCSSRENRLVFIGHQANRIMLNTVCERAGIKEENHWFNVDRFGNTGSAGAPVVLSQHWDEIRPQEQIAIVTVGAGLTWTRMLLKVGYGT